MYFINYKGKDAEKVSKYRRELFMCVIAQVDNFGKNDVLPLDELLNELMRSETD